MRNLYLITNTDSQSSVTEISEAIDDLAHMEPEIADESRDILLSPEKRQIYDSIHRQFSIYAALQMPENLNDEENQWQKRLVEFSPPEED